MQKDFDTWNQEKKIIHKEKQTDDFFVNPREIWFVKMGMNIGFEENGKDQFLRPVIVLRRVGNLFFTVAMTSKGKDNHPFYFKVNVNEITLENPKYQESTYVILSQVKIMDKKRFFKSVGRVSMIEFKRIQEKLKTILF